MALANPSPELNEGAFLRESVFPRALRHSTSTFGIVGVWWGLALMNALVAFLVFGVEWYFALVGSLALLVIGLLATRWDEHHIKIYRLYERQADVYEPGYFSHQKHFKRPEGMGREIPG